jgi:hypothetical protein
LPAIATPATPAASGLKLFGQSVAGRIMPTFVGPSGRDSALQPYLGRNKIALWSASGNNLADTQLGTILGSTGTSTGVNVATTNFRTRMRWREWLVTTASTTAVAGLRQTALQFSVGADIPNTGGFLMGLIWSPATGVSNASHRAFAGMRASGAAPTDVNPSTLTNMVGMGYDSADANIQFMHNDGSGTATKIDLGASFPKPNVDRTAVYQIEMFSPPGTTQAVHYLVRDLVSGASSSGTVTTDIPGPTTLLALQNYISVGGVSSVVGLGASTFYIETDF